ncbi:NADH:flavin oxidoreductase [Steroidobacter sp.]|uniref:NADH:flavin oxidoreductase n=1 Tax=Steroidobacter sp. TaxID=1978227 RepID=UPI001A5EB568|nr:NADH:flavin oxidoreductase [Steroidobacter sp.]MBL8271621.1 NADH:flavin oxidoreductase [Steroidobacter sp.]
MTRSVDALFRPFTLNGLQLPNRIVMAPMTRWHSPEGVPGADVAAYYRRRAENDCGLIITEGTTVDHPVASYSVRVPNFHGAALPAWRNVVEQVHDAGGKIMPQLWHVGVSRRPAMDYPNKHLPSVSPSGLFLPEKSPVAPPATQAEIRAVIDAFASAARAARELGFDGVAIHGAHGYLFDQFFWAPINRRDDEYGGDLIGRTRFAVETLQAIRREVGADFPILFRISQWKEQDYTAKLARSPQELGELLQILATAGVDAFDCSQRRYWEPEFPDSSLNLAGWAKQLTGKATMTVGSVGLSKELVTRGSEALGQRAEVANLDPLLERLEAGEFDLVAVGRAMLADPEWPKKVREQRFDELRPFTPQALENLF